MGKFFREINPRRRYSVMPLYVCFSLFVGFFGTSATMSLPQVKGAHTQLSPRRIPVHALTISPNDTYYATQWGMPKIKAPQGWDVSTGSDTTVVAVLDTGVLSTHEDLTGKLVAGYDFVGDDTNANPDPGGGDAFYHGTLVASVIAASTDNGKGVAGVCWDCKIMPVRVMNNSGSGDTHSIAQGIRFAVDNGADVINMSLGYEYSLGSDPEVESAVDYAYDNGVVMVAAAGNDGKSVNYPAAYPHVISVGATDSGDTKASWSSYGSALDVMAPGVSVTAACTFWSGGAYTTNDYCYASGTSLAAPYVAGLTALVISYKPDYFASLKASAPSLVNDNMLSRMTTQADKVSGMNSSYYTSLYGYGRINNYNSLAHWLSIVEPKSGTVTAKRDITFRGSTLSGENVDISLDGGVASQVTANSSGEWTYALSGLSYATHSVSATSDDMAGAPQTVTANYRVLAKTPVYRFWSAAKTDHYYTRSKSERDRLIRDYPNNVWLYQGIAFYTYSSPVIGTTPIYRFWSSTKKDHYYTRSKSERDRLIRDYPNNVWLYQGVAFYTPQ